MNDNLSQLQWDALGTVTLRSTGRGNLGFNPNTGAIQQRTLDALNRRGLVQTVIRRGEVRYVPTIEGRRLRTTGIA